MSCKDFMAKPFLRELKVDGVPQSRWTPFFRKMEVRKSLSAKMDMAIMAFQDVSSDLIASTSLQKNTKISFRWSAQGVVSKEHHYLLNTADVEYSGNQGTVTLHLSDYRLALMSNSAHCSYGQKGIAEIVEEIAESYPELDPPVIEKTVTVDKDPSSGAYLQCGENDWDFILKLYNDHPVSEKNKRGQYRLFWHLGKELHFHPPDYNQPPYRKVVLFRGSTSAKLKMRVSPFRAFVRGTEGVRVAGLLPDQVSSYLSTVVNQVGQSVGRTVGSFLAAGQSIGSTLSNMPLTSRRSGSYKGLFRIQEGNNNVLYDDASQSSHDDARREMEQAELYLTGDPAAEPGLMILIDAYSGSQKHMSHGLWLVEEVYHNIQAQEDHNTVLRLSRPYESTGVRQSTNLANSGGFMVTFNNGKFETRLPFKL